MNNESRIKNVSYNIFFNLIFQFFNILLSFGSRTIFIKTLGADYLGINGLYTNILTILSFAELGVGSAIVYSMYSPIATKDIEKLKSLMALYKKAYISIGTIIFLLGILIIPFLNFFIAQKPNINENLILIYFLFLLNTSSSYFFLYKRSIIVADQKDYIAVINEQTINIFRTIIQMIVLIIFHAYIPYLLLQVLGTIVTNIMIARKADRMYPFLKEKALPLEKDEKSAIFTNIKALVLYRLSSVVLNGTDSLIISAMLGVTYVGLASNYLLITTTFNSVLAKVKDAFVASIGNLNATENEEKRYRTFEKLFLICALLYGYTATGVMLLGENFIQLWVGENYMLPTVVLFSIVLSFYENGVHFAAYTYRTTLGYFVQGKIAPICAALLNIVLSIWFGRIMGLSGIFFATTISRGITYGIVDPYLIFKNSFHKSVSLYYIRYVGYVILFIGSYLVSKLVLNQINILGWYGFIAKGFIFTIIFIVIVLLALCRSSIFKEIIESILHVIRKKRK